MNSSAIKKKKKVVFLRFKKSQRHFLPTIFTKILRYFFWNLIGLLAKFGNLIGAKFSQNFCQNCRFDESFSSNKYSLRCLFIYSIYRKKLK